ncbi:MAG TPA: hypothetical protein VFY68_18600 [Nitrososphaeraceae archaeon]|nr:hypothetical protein [Nitrososphaeraceae archaeon]
MREKEKSKITDTDTRDQRNYPFIIYDHKRQQMIKEGGNASQLTHHKNDHLHDHFLDFDFSPFFADFAAFFFAAIFNYIKKGNRI